MDWDELVSRALLLSSYNTVDDIKDVLRKRFRTGKRVHEKRVDVWYRWLVRYDEIQQRDALFMQWSSLWNLADFDVEPIPYDTPLDEVRQRIKTLEERLYNG